MAKTTTALRNRLRSAYIAQYEDDGALDVYIEAWEATVAKLGRDRAIALFWEIMAALPAEMRSDCDPEGN